MRYPLSQSHNIREKGVLLRQVSSSLLIRLYAQGKLQFY